MALDDYYNDPYQTGIDPYAQAYPNFWGGGQASLEPAQTAPENAAQLQPATTAASNSGNAALWAQVGQNPQAFVQALIARDKLAGKQTDPSALNHILAALKEVGVNATLDQRNDQYHKGIMLNGQFIRLLDGSDRWTWEQGGGGSSAPPAMPDQSLTAPFTEGFQDPYGKPAPFSYKDFVAPTGESVKNEPGYQFGLDQGLKTINHTAAAQGSLLTGGTFKGLQDYAQNYAGSKYQDAFNRELTGWGANRENAASNYSQNYQTQYVDPYAHNWQEYLTRGNIFNQNKDSAFSKYFQTAQLGANAARD